MCYGFVWFDLSSSKRIPDDPLTRKPGRSGRSGACEEPPLIRYSRCCFQWLWILLFIVLFLLFLFLMGARIRHLLPSFPFFCCFPQSPLDSQEGHRRSSNPGGPRGGPGSFQNRPGGGDGDVNEGMAPLTRSGEDPVGGGGDSFRDSSTSTSYTNPPANAGTQGSRQDVNTNNNNNNNKPRQSDTQNSGGWFDWGSSSPPVDKQNHGQGQDERQSKQVPNSETGENEGVSPKTIKGENENRGWFGWGKSSSPESVNKDSGSTNNNNNNNLNSNGNPEKFHNSDEKRKGDQSQNQGQEQLSPSRSKTKLNEWRPIINKKNYALCTDGAFEYRTLNFPPFRGYESLHGSYHILQPGLDTNFKWHFNPPGDVIVQLSQPISIDGMTLIHLSPERHFGKDFSTTPKNFELYGTSKQRGISKGVHNPVLLGRFHFTHRKEGFQYFPVQTISNERFSHVELRFLNSYENPEFVDVYRIEVHGKP